LASRELVITGVTWSRVHDFTTWMERSISASLLSRSRVCDHSAKERFFMF